MALIEIILQEKAQVAIAWLLHSAMRNQDSMIHDLLGSVA